MELQLIIGGSCPVLKEGSYNPIPISQPKFLNPIVPVTVPAAQILIPFPFSIVSLLINPSAWNTIFPAQKREIPVPILPLQDPPIAMFWNKMSIVNNLRPQLYTRYRIRGIRIYYHNFKC
jgi:hypothetical protein